MRDSAPSFDTIRSLTVRQALADAFALLQQAGCDTPRLDAELLLAHLLGSDRARLVIDAGVVLEAAQLVAFCELVQRRAAREPVAYILGSREFRHITLCVDRRVLIPRPETELLVEVGLSLPTGALVIDVGTGSGAVALALKQERPDLTVFGSDVSEDALAVARGNAMALGLDVTFVCGDLLDGVVGPFDAVLTNLPYVESDAALPADVAQYEPAGALFGGEDGLDVVRRLVGMLGGVPFVALEIGMGQAGAVAALLEDVGFTSVEQRRDLAGIERVVAGRR